MKEFDIRLKNGKAQIVTPYNPDFVSRIKREIGGRKWDSDTKCWMVPANAADQVRAIMRDVYGRDDAEPARTKTVTIRYTRYVRAVCRPITAMGKVIASASGRDSGARIGDGVVLVEGSVQSGGAG